MLKVQCDHVFTPNKMFICPEKHDDLDNFTAQIIDILII